MATVTTLKMKAHNHIIHATIQNSEYINKFEDIKLNSTAQTYQE